jgi:hypothetical protein
MSGKLWPSPRFVVGSPVRPIRRSHVARALSEEQMRFVRRCAVSCEARLVEADIQRRAGNCRMEFQWLLLARKASALAFEAVA